VKETELLWSQVSWKLLGVEVQTSLNGKCWEIRQADEGKASRLCTELGIGPILARLLVLRGFEEPDQVYAFLNPSLENLVEPSRFVEMPAATARLFQALENKERILIHGDYDVDGISASALMVEYLCLRGWDADVVLPSRFEEGFGLSAEKVREASAKGYSLLLTVDCGITANEEIALARSLGIDVIVTDHHEPGPERPAEAVAILDPKLPGSGYPHEILSGTGVAYKLVEALEFECRQQGKKAVDLCQWHDIVALGTIADVVPLLGENRILVRSGLGWLKAGDRPGVKALMEKTGLIQERIGVWSVSFILAPRLNAAGRLGDPRIALDLLLSKDYSEALDLAGILDETNQERRTLEGAVKKDCERMISQSPETAEREFILLAKPDWPKGVLGIVASRIAETYNRPTILLTIEGDEANGSGRSVPGFNLVECLRRCEGLMFSYGGHEGAVGLRLDKKNVSGLRKGLIAAARDMVGPEPLISRLYVDGELSLDDIDNRLVSELDLMEPHGEGNRAPLFVTSNVEVEGKGQIFGNNHLKFVLGKPSRPVEAIAFSQGGLLAKIGSRRVDMVYTLGKRSFRGVEKLELIIRDLRMAEGGDEAGSVSSESKTKRRVVDWRGRSNLLGCLQQEYEKSSGKVIFAVDFEETIRSPLVDWLRTRTSEDHDIIEAGCFGEACATLHSEPGRVALAPVWRNEGVILGLEDVEEEALKVFVLSLPTGEFAGTARLLDGLRDHRESLWVYLAFGQEECDRKNVQIADSYPNEDTLRQVYRYLQSVAFDGRVRVAKALEGWSSQGLQAVTLRAAVAIFEELEFLEILDEGAVISFQSVQKKRSLSDSAAFRHGELQRQSFEQWSRWALRAPAPEVARKI